MSKAIVEAVAAQFGMTKKLAGEIVTAVFGTLAAEVAAGEKVRVTGLGSFSVKDKPARAGRNPKTGEAIEIAARKAVKFTAATALKETL
jgi:nucleoid DNA-binding protein